jgi:hypothetical protein
MTPLTAVASLSDEQRARLRDLSVTTVEELAGLIVADPQPVRQTLAMDEPTFDAFRAEVWSHLEPQAIAELERPVPHYGLGAQAPRPSEDPSQ